MRGIKHGLHPVDVNMNKEPQIQRQSGSNLSRTWSNSRLKGFTIGHLTIAHLYKHILMNQGF